MRRESLYSSSRGRPSAEFPTPESADQPRPDNRSRSLEDRLRVVGPFVKRYERPLLALTGGVITICAVWFHAAIQTPARQITQQDINAAVRHTLMTEDLPSVTARAYEAIRPSVVRVRGMGTPGGEVDENTETGVGSGVVIVDKGVILTNLHVVSGAKRVKVVFADGLESDASIIALQAEDDLAVLQAAQVPDDLVPATLRSTGDLAPGDTVVAVGFPFGIGPSASAGVVSGLRRTYQSPEGKRIVSNLIQFDAAVNPGSSGGPLVTMDGSVVGIVTAILNPSSQRVFIGIGFAVPIENAASAVGIHPF